MEEVLRERYGEGAQGSRLLPVHHAPQTATCPPACKFFGFFMEASRHSYDGLNHPPLELAQPQEVRGVGMKVAALKSQGWFPLATSSHPW